MSKRVFDIVVSATALLVAAPLLLVIAVLIVLDSKGPVFFRQRRIGQHGHPFSILKFRTMVVNAAAVGPRLTQKRDPRITHLGQLLRWLKLDELPQLINVLRGDMSLVGPRPEDPYFVARYTPAQREVLTVRPGIVGPSQIRGRDELEMYPEDVTDPEEYYVERILPEKLAIDLDYVRSCTLRGDLRLIAGAIAVTVFGAFKVKFFRVKREAMALLAADAVASVVVYGVAYGVKFDWDVKRADVPVSGGRHRGYPACSTAGVRLLRSLSEHCSVFGHQGVYGHRAGGDRRLGGGGGPDLHGRVRQSLACRLPR